MLIADSVECQDFLGSFCCQQWRHVSRSLHGHREPASGAPQDREPRRREGERLLRRRRGGRRRPGRCDHDPRPTCRDHGNPAPHHPLLPGGEVAAEAPPGPLRRTRRAVHRGARGATPPGGRATRPRAQTACDTRTARRGRCILERGRLARAGRLPARIVGPRRAPDRLLGRVDQDARRHAAGHPGTARGCRILRPPGPRMVGSQRTTAQRRRGSGAQRCGRRHRGCGHRDPEQVAGKGRRPTDRPVREGGAPGSGKRCGHLGDGGCSSARSR